MLKLMISESWAEKLNIIATSFKLLGIDLDQLISGMVCIAERRGADAGEVTVGYLVIIYNYITAITLPPFPLPPPPNQGHMARPG